MEPRRPAFSPSFIGAIALVAVLLVGCGDDGESGSTPAGPEGAVEETILTYVFEGDCDVMTDAFLEKQARARQPVGDTREEQCEGFQDNVFVEKQYTAENVTFPDIEVIGSRATAVVGVDFDDVEITYTLVEEDGKWRIDTEALT